MPQKIILNFTMAAILGLAFIISPATAEEKQKTESSKTQTSVNKPAIISLKPASGSLRCERHYSGRCQSRSSFLRQQDQSGNEFPDRRHSGRQSLHISANKQSG